MKASKSQLARIHIAAKDLGLDDVVYRQILINETGKRSAADLTYGQARTVIEYFESAGWKPKNEGSGFNVEHRTLNIERPSGQKNGFASPRELRMIQGMWADLSYAPKDRQQGALREFLSRKFGCSDLRFLSDIGAQKVINALVAMKRQARGKRREAKGNYALP
jgi:hypothetical protein